MKMQKNERGITLVALVVTIVVLLILAGVTIMYVMSDNGIFKQAQEAGTKSDAAAVQEAVATALQTLYVEVYTGTPATGETTLNLKTSFDANMPSVMTLGGTYTVTATPGSVSTLALGDGLEVTYKGKTYTVTYKPNDETHIKDGTAGVLAKVKGATTEP